MSDDTNQQPQSASSLKAFTPVEMTARLVILEQMTMDIAASIEAMVAHDTGMTLAGVRSHLANLHKAMLDSLLETNAEVFDAGLPFAGQAIQAMYANVERAMKACGGEEATTFPAPDRSGSSEGGLVN